LFLVDYSYQCLMQWNASSGVPSIYLSVSYREELKILNVSTNVSSNFAINWKPVCVCRHAYNDDDDEKGSWLFKRSGFMLDFIS
jgi:hypothetical protein